MSDKPYYKFRIKENRVSTTDTNSTSDRTNSNSKNSNSSSLTEIIEDIEKFQKVITSTEAKDQLTRYNIQASLFYQEIDTDKNSPDNRFGGYFNISTDLKYVTFRIFVYLILKWMKGELSFSDKINGIIFNAKKQVAYCQVWVNDGFKYDVLHTRYEELAEIIMGKLYVPHNPKNSSAKNEGSNYLYSLEFFPHQNYRDTSPSKTYGYKVKPFGQIMEEVSPDILQIPKEAKFNMGVATTHKILWSLRREKQSSNPK
ncbi:hypothetical protein TVAG_476650 [Trichomonas vaginalis G3]|uniref:Uncharacterized protein n=1 Tax=Trichomonas vaginalis (strain ATCC PRA-98 / G3) TaxID=412133 RepID=A2DA88_TRIV3|nr:RNA Cap, translation initiation factor Eif4e domain-containing protein [Trichomonas vaginalis G3]EAY22736.1 hypothetical protein TVAG_476650 [Trichomonas vaginalis G3]KAI5525547.1 RNA Cap, translation initiation factor Eif4e domain-containing protein [Trichomonas vaginalis G3]|eukprot:XP_001583722.1 hypothetical protein [Trichomonas vaginalis G3]